MKCPVDGTLLTMSDRQGVEIDYLSEVQRVGSTGVNSL